MAVDRMREELLDDWPNDRAGLYTSPALQEARTKSAAGGTARLHPPDRYGSIVDQSQREIEGLGETQSIGRLQKRANSLRRVPPSSRIARRERERERWIGIIIASALSIDRGAKIRPIICGRSVMVEGLSDMLPAEKFTERYPHPVVVLL